MNTALAALAFGVLPFAPMSMTSLAAASSPTADVEAAALNDAQIIQLLTIAAQGDADCANEALDSSHEIRIKGYADDLIRDGQLIRKQAQELLSRTGITLQDSADGAALKERIKSDVTNLHAAYGRIFDHDFLTQQIDAQFAWVNLLEQKLTPAASELEVKTLVEQARVLAARHLLFARQLRGDL